MLRQHPAGKHERLAVDHVSLAVSGVWPTPPFAFSQGGELRLLTVSPMVVLTVSSRSSSTIIPSASRWSCPFGLLPVAIIAATCTCFNARTAPLVDRTTETRTHNAVWTWHEVWSKVSECVSDWRCMGGL